MTTFKKMAKRKMFKFFKKYSYFKTGKGAINHIVEHDTKRVYFRSEKGSMINTIELRKLFNALSFVYEKRTVVRKELEIYSSFSSALLGLIINILKGVVKVTHGVKGLRITLVGVRFFFSGCDRAVKDLEIASQNGAKFVLMSYYYLRNDKNKNWKRHAERLGLKIMLDSGAFTVFNRQRKGKPVVPLDIHCYIDFIKENMDILHSYINLDVIGDATATFKNEALMRENGLSPITVFPADGELDELAKLLEKDDDYIAIGATVQLKEEEKRNLFSSIFDRFPEARLHWLGGSSSIIKEFPWFSADSSTWLSGRKYGKIMNSEFKTIKAPLTMNGLEALAHNVKLLSRLEYV